MLQNLGGWHLLVIVFIVLLLFGAPKLPGLAKSLGQSMRILKKEVSSENTEKTDGTAPAAAPTVASETAAPAPVVEQPVAKEPNTDVR
ncbi:twin-arginine translocase TatA/TatE family subunit [Leucobacter coleopterorum]|uniref:Sec-independent protein translocase protein TatA n=1 Tax=Leucobacter coleopterorum TaxID=2714933 RepID=A0ABX6JUM7_9MICO|nr:twin-arginine translocase TatA/TatE family subunit [Leucobacter coleopterorum]QIM17998.1 twin-arginine translocase TatA/TatE family subunit [Leucobacter coleopterorum]